MSHAIYNHIDNLLNNSEIQLFFDMIIFIFLFIFHR